MVLCEVHQLVVIVLTNAHMGMKNLCICRLKCTNSALKDLVARNLNLKLIITVFCFDFSFWVLESFKTI